jgi:tetratricopeptide (TPR) repeat protein
MSYEDAVRSWYAGDIARTIELCRGALDGAPEHVDALNLLGMALSKSGEQEQARDVFERALRVQDRADLRNNLGLVHKIIGNADLALDNYLAAIRMLPQYAEAHGNLGRLLAERDNPGAAIKHMVRALEFNPKQTELKCELARLLGERGEVNAALHYAVEATIDLLARTAGSPPKEFETKPLDRERYWRALVALAAVLDDAKLPFFLGDGTLLGFVREGSFIAHDKDIDLGMWDAVPREAVLNALDAASEFWIAPTVITSPRARHADAEAKLLISTRWRDQINIDLFFYRDFGNGVVHGFARGNHEILWRQTRFELTSGDWNGHAFPIPHQAERYLTELYGDWRNPDPDYCAFVCGDIVGRLPPLCLLHALMSLQQSLVSRRASRSAKIAQGILERSAPDLDGRLAIGLRKIAAGAPAAMSRQPS